MRSLLDHQADGIEYTLHTHGIEASVIGGNISPRLIQFNIKLGAGVKYNRVAALSDELALALGVSHCRITRDGYFVRIEVPRPDPVPVLLFPLMRNLPGDLPVNSAVLGLDESGVPLLLRIDSPDIGHILISGTTGSGKTVLARSMISSLALQNTPDQLKLLLIDPKGRGYRDFEGLPNLVCPVVTDPLDGLHRLRWAVRHMEKRYESGINSPLLVIFVDELADLVAAGGRELEAQVVRLTQRGREVGIHLVACTHKPSTSVIGSIARSNFPTRLVGRVVSAEEARVASGVAGSGADRLLGRGDFLLFARGEVTRVQAAHISPDEMRQTVEHLGGVPMAARTPRRREEPRPVNTPEMAPRQEFQRRQPANAPQEYDYDDDFEEEYYEPRRAPRRFQSARSNEYSPQVESEGVAERLARYREEIERRRQGRPTTSAYNKPDQDDEDAGFEFERPSRAQPPRPASRRRPVEDDLDDDFEPVARPKPRIPQPAARSKDLWDDNAEDEENNQPIMEAGEPDDEDDDFDAPAPPPARPNRPAPNPVNTPKSKAPVTRYSSEIEGRNIITSLRTRQLKLGS